MYAEYRIMQNNLFGLLLMGKVGAVKPLPCASHCLCPPGSGTPMDCDPSWQAEPDHISPALIIVICLITGNCSSQCCHACNNVTDYTLSCLQLCNLLHLETVILSKLLNASKDVIVKQPLG